MKIMKKISIVWEVEKISWKKKMDVGESVESDPFMVGGLGFKVHLYPQGEEEDDYIDNQLCLTIENLSAHTVVELVHGFEILHPQTCFPFDYYFPQHKTNSCFHTRCVYRNVSTLQPGHQTESFTFSDRLLSHNPTAASSFVSGDSIKVRTTIGIFIDADADAVAVDRFIFFQLAEEEEEEERFYAEESVLRKSCPALLLLLPNDSESHSTNLVLSDIEPDVFAAVLWFIYKGKLHDLDVIDITQSKPRDPNSFYKKLRSAANRFEMRRLREMCDAVVIHGYNYEMGIAVDKYFYIILCFCLLSFVMVFYISRFIYSTA